MGLIARVPASPPLRRLRASGPCAFSGLFIECSLSRAHARQPRLLLLRSIAPQAPASQPPIHDAHDRVALRAWLNAPWSSSAEGDLYKAANILRGFARVGARKAQISNGGEGSIGA